MKTRFLLIPCIALLSGGCFLQKKPAVAVPAAPVPARAPQATPAPSPASQAAPAPAPPPPPVTARPQPVPATATPAPSTPTPQSGKPSPFPPATLPATLPATPTPKPAPAPALGTVLTTDQRTQLNIAYQSDLRQANTVLDGLKGRSLTKDQNDTVSRARAFIAQAAQYHDRDLTTAAELARRARLLTQDLAGTLK